MGFQDLRVRSIRTKLLGLVAGVSLLVAACSTVYHSWSSNDLMREQIVKRGRYIASNLAYNSKYGVSNTASPALTDPPGESI